MYSPEISDALIPRLYRLARVRKIPMTRLVDTIVTEYLSKSSEELARYDPKIHDRRASELPRAA